MNQILNEFESTNSTNTSIRKKIFSPKQISLKIILFISIILIVSCIIYFIHRVYKNNQEQLLAQKMLNNFNITTLYSNSTDYKTNLDLNNTNAFVIGMIQIPSIDVHYPIISELSESNLKIAPCKFYGPMPNQVGNLCIAAHNYRNYQFFSNLNKLNSDDIIDIYDFNGNKISYCVYDKYITDSSYLECTSQNTNGEKHITLVTCNKPDNTKRIIVKAKEKK